jgi:hypothetical protein
LRDTLHGRQQRARPDVALSVAGGSSCDFWLALLSRAVELGHDAGVARERDGGGSVFIAEEDDVVAGTAPLRHEQHGREQANGKRTAP